MENLDTYIARVPAINRWPLSHVNADLVLLQALFSSAFHKLAEFGEAHLLHLLVCTRGTPTAELLKYAPGHQRRGVPCSGVV